MPLTCNFAGLCARQCLRDRDFEIGYTRPGNELWSRFDPHLPPNQQLPLPLDHPEEEKLMNTSALIK